MNLQLHVAHKYLFVQHNSSHGDNALSFNIAAYTASSAYETQYFGLVNTHKSIPYRTSAACTMHTHTPISNSDIVLQ